ncbi:MAG TPA: nucleotidyltransferase family protein [Patescibacteria group bacterium]|nr:nucleotidyltransferase family protein [Patescibacteria group bacterium]
MSKELKRQLQIIDENLEKFRKDYYIKKIGIFGSVARGVEKRKSDIDILVEFGEPIGIFKFIELENNLTKLLKRKVDLVSKDALKPILKSAILKEVIYV